MLNLSRKQPRALNKAVTDSIRGSNQYLVGLSALISSFNYYRMGRLVVPLAVSLGLGSILGAWGSVTLSAGKISFSQYQGYFGLFVLALGMYLFYETSSAGQASKKKAKSAAQAFEATVKKQKSGEKVDTAALGVKVTKFSLTEVVFTFYGVEFKFNPLIPFVGGIVISAVAAFLGVGGGFLLVPFLTSVAELPMYLAAGTSALAVLISMITSIITLISKGVQFDWMLIGLELVGIAVGSVIGPRTSKYFSDLWLKRLFIVLALYVGVDYVLRGFLKLQNVRLNYGRLNLLFLQNVSGSLPGKQIVLSFYELTYPVFSFLGPLAHRPLPLVAFADRWVSSRGSSPRPVLYSFSVISQPRWLPTSTANI